MDYYQRKFRRRDEDIDKLIYVCRRTFNLITRALTWLVRGK